MNGWICARLSDFTVSRIATMKELSSVFGNKADRLWVQRKRLRDARGSRACGKIYG